MTFFKRLTLLAFFASILPLATQAATITVNTTEDEINTDGDCSLREAIVSSNSDTATDACTAGSGVDTIVIPAGTYTLSLTGSGEDLSVTGDLDILQDVTLSGAGASATIINGNGTVTQDRVFHIDPALSTIGISVTISGLTIRGGRTTSAGGGILISGEGSLRLSLSHVEDNVGGGSGGGGIALPESSGGSLILSGSTISGNESDTHGGGIYTFEASVLITDGSVISGNTALHAGGGISTGDNSSILEIIESQVSDNTSFAGGGVFSLGMTRITDSTVSGNSASGNGGGLHLSDSEILGTTIQDNDAINESNGGGLYTDGSFTKISNSSISNNRSDGAGGGLYFGADIGVIEDSHITDNLSNSNNDDNADGPGGGIYSQANSLTILRSHITGNTSNRYWAGGIGFESGSGSSLLIEDSTISDNTSTDSYGGGLVLDTYSCIIRSSTISGNSALGDTQNSGTTDSEGGGMYINGGSHCVIENTTIANNIADGGGGGIANFAELQLNHVTITGNTADHGVGGASNDTGGGIYHSGVSGLLVLNSIISGNSDAGSSGNEYADCFTNSSAYLVSSGPNIIQDTTGCTIHGDTPISADPLFDTAGLIDNGGLTLTISLQSGSPAIDAGGSTTCLPTDQRGASRPVDGNSDSTAQCDLGAVELSSTVPTLATETLGQNQASGGCSLVR